MQTIHTVFPHDFDSADLFDTKENVLYFKLPGSAAESLKTESSVLILGYAPWHIWAMNTKALVKLNI